MNRTRISRRHGRGTLRTDLFLAGGDFVADARTSGSGLYRGIAKVDLSVALGRRHVVPERRLVTSFAIFCRCSEGGKKSFDSVFSVRTEKSFPNRFFCRFARTGVLETRKNIHETTSFRPEQNFSFPTRKKVRDSGLCKILSPVTKNHTPPPREREAATTTARRMSHRDGSDDDVIDDDMPDFDTVYGDGEDRIDSLPSAPISRPDRLRAIRRQQYWQRWKARRQPSGLVPLPLITRPYAAPGHSSDDSSISSSDSSDSDDLPDKKPKKDLGLSPKKPKVRFFYRLWRRNRAHTDTDIRNRSSGSPYRKTTRDRGRRGRSTTICPSRRRPECSQKVRGSVAGTPAIF